MNKLIPKKLVRILLVLVLCVYGFSVFAQKKEVDNQFSVHTFYSTRRSDFVKNWQQSLLRLGINYKLNDKLILTPGYDWAINFPYGKQPIATKIIE